jgi:hypothetical protein
MDGYRSALELGYILELWWREEGAVNDKGKGRVWLSKGLHGG